MGKYRIEGKVYTAATPDEAYEQHAIASTQSPGMLTGLMQQFGQGASLGFHDELQALGEAAAGGKYRQSMRRQQRERDLFQQEHPYLSAGATTLGAVAPMAMSLFAAPATGGAAPAAAGARSLQLIGNAFRGQALPPALTTAQAIGQGAKYGAAFGGVAGYGSANPDAPGGNALGTLEGAAVGAAAGAALPAAQAGLAAVDRKVTPVLRRALAGTGLGPTIPGSPIVPRGPGGGPAPAPASSAEAKVLRALEDAGLTPEQAAMELQRAQNAGVPLGLMDVGGQPTLRLARGTRTLPGAGSAQIDSFLEGRAAGQPGRVKRVLERALGRRMDPNAGAVSDNLLNRARNESSPLYGQLGNEQVADQQLLDLLQVPAVREILVRRDAQRAQWGQGGSPLFGPDGALVRTPTLADVNDVNVTLNQMLAPSYQRMGGRPLESVDFATREGRQLAQGLQRQMLGLADAGPGGQTFATARARYAEPAQARAQYESGLEFGNPNADLQDIVSQMNGSPADTRWYTRGVAAALRNRIDNMPDLGQRPNVLRSVYSSPNQRAKLDAVVPDSRRAAMRGRLDMENQAAQNSNFVRGGSQTADKLMEGADVALDVAETATTGGSGVAAAAKALWNTVRGQFGEKSRTEIARILTTVEPAEQRAVLDRLIQLNQQGKLRSEEIGRVVQAMTIQNQTE